MLGLFKITTTIIAAAFLACREFHDRPALVHGMTVPGRCHKDSSDSIGSPTIDPRFVAQDLFLQEASSQGRWLPRRRRTVGKMKTRLRQLSDQTLNTDVAKSLKAYFQAIHQFRDGIELRVSYASDHVNETILRWTDNTIWTPKHFDVVLARVQKAADIESSASQMSRQGAIYDLTAILRANGVRVNKLENMAFLRHGENADFLKRNGVRLEGLEEDDVQLLRTLAHVCFGIITIASAALAPPA